MAKKDYKDTIVLDPGMEEGIENVEPNEVEELREKCRGMSKGELIDFLVQTHENLWSSHDQRDYLEEQIRLRDERLADINTQSNESVDKISKLERDNEDLADQLAKARAREQALQSQANESSQLKSRISELERELNEKDKTANKTQLDLEESYKAKINNRDEAIKKLKKDLKKCKDDLEKANDDKERLQNEADSYKADFDFASNANFAGMIVRDIPREMGLGFEAADEKTKEEFEVFMSTVRDRYLSVACGAIKAADDKILSQETAADELKDAEKELEDSESLEKLAIQRKEAARKKFEEKKRNFIEAKGEA